MSEERRRDGDVFQVGKVTGGVVSFGAHSRATYHEAPKGPALDETVSELLNAVQALRSELAALAANDATRQARHALDETEREITHTGRVAPDRLRRLRQLLDPGTTIVGALASAATVTQAATQLLG